MSIIMKMVLLTIINISDSEFKNDPENDNDTFNNIDYENYRKIKGNE